MQNNHDEYMSAFGLDNGSSSRNSVYNTSSERSSSLTAAIPPSSMNGDDIFSDSQLLTWDGLRDFNHRSQDCAIMEVRPPTANVDEMYNSGVHISNARKSKRGKCAEDTERLRGKPLVDAYSKRSATLIEKGKELANLTGAYVVIFTARPESIGMGNHRFYASENLLSAGDPMVRIRGATHEIKAAAAELMHGSRLTKRPRTTINGEHSGIKEQDLHRISTRKSGSPARPPIVAHVTVEQGQAAETLYQPAGLSYRFCTLPNPIASFAISTVPIEDAVVLTSGTSDSPKLSLERNEILSVVLLLKMTSVNMQLCSLTAIRELVLSNEGVEAIHDAQAIPRLVQLLDNYSPKTKEVICCSALVLFQMSRHQRSCDVMVAAGVIPSLCRLLSYPLGDEVLSASVRTLNKCAGNAFHFLSNFLPDNAHVLANLLSPGCTKASLAIAEVIKKAHGSRQLRRLPSGTLLSLSRLASECTTLSELETVISAIRAVYNEDDVYPNKGPYDHEIFQAIDQQLLQPLMSCLSHRDTKIRIGAYMALHCLSCNRTVARHFGEREVLPRLIPLLSTDDDEVFALAASTLCQWATHLNCKAYETSITFDSIPRFVRLLSHKEDHVVLSAALGIIYANERQNNLLEVVEAGGVGILIGLLSSRNLDVVRVALSTIFSLFPFETGLESCYVDLFVKRGLISATTRWLSSGFHPLLRLILNGIRIWLGESPAVGEALVTAGAIPRLVHLLSSSDRKIISNLVLIIGRLASGSSATALLHVGVARPLIQCVRFARVKPEDDDVDEDDSDDDDWLQNLLDDWEYYSVDGHVVIIVIVNFIKFSSKSRMEFQAAGTESVLANHLSAHAHCWLSTCITEALALLREGETRPA